MAEDGARGGGGAIKEAHVTHLPSPTGPAVGRGPAVASLPGWGLDKLLGAAWHPNLVCVCVLGVVRRGSLAKRGDSGAPLPVGVISWASYQFCFSLLICQLIRVVSAK